MVGTPERRLRPTAVVTSFLYREGRLLVLRRSGDVGTHRGKWAGVSGYAERVPLLQARVEIAEETGAAPSDVTLRGIGAPLPVDDPQEQRTWLVYPFLFELSAAAQIRTDWESVGLAWVAPSELAELDAVPGLSAAFDRVWPPLIVREFWAALELVAGDAVHGATHLAGQALAAVESLRTRSAARGAGALLRAARAVGALRPSMGVLPHLMARLLLDTRDEGLAVAHASRRLQDELHDGAAQAATHAASRLSGCRRVLTHSYSSACRDALLRWSAKAVRPEVVCMESRLALEGVALARELAAAGIRVTLITDAQVGLFAGEVDAVLIGVDAITERDTIINKAGTYPLALAAGAAGTPVYAVGHTLKVVPPGWPVALEAQGWPQAPVAEGLRVRNVVFDETPLGDVTELIGEDGRLTAERLDEVRSGIDGSGLVVEA
jgi:translation initiation factor 2B subunit (eIF-2B alpha/beta/delta family)